MQQLLSVLLLSLSANLDTFLIAVSYGLNNIKISFVNSLVITIITTIGTYFSIKLGEVFSEFMPGYLPSILGGFVLIFIGLWVIMDYILKPKEENVETFNEYSDKTIKQARKISTKEIIPIALALTVNNVGIGVAAGVANINIIYSTLFTFIITIFCINLGSYVVKSLVSTLIGKYSTILSGILIVILGIYELFV